MGGVGVGWGWESCIVVQGISESSLLTESVSLPASMTVGLGLSHTGLLLCVPGDV